MATFAQLLEQRHGSAHLLAHIEPTHACQAHDLVVRHGAHDGVTVRRARCQCRKHRLNVRLHEQHRAHDDVCLGNIRVTACQCIGVILPVTCGMNAQAQIRYVSLQAILNTFDGTPKVPVKSDDRDRNGLGCFSAHSGPWLRRGFQW